VIRVTLLGTGGSAGVPLLGGADGHGDWGACDPGEARNRRSRSAIHIRGGAGGLLVDTGPDLRTQLLCTGIRDVDAILYTHAHADHITGLDDVRILNRIMGKPIPAYGTAETLADVATRFPYAFRPWRPPGFYRPVLTQNVVTPGESVDLAGMAVRLFDQDHGFVRTLGLRVGDFAYSTDVFALDEAAFAVLEGVRVWVVGAFQRSPHQTHAPLGKVLDWVRRLRPERTILTHMGVEMDWAWLAQNLPEGVEAGFDGMVLETMA
jgi:phosphoribosyl 1,2-cyclic phosphate phosphodiesterase